MGLEVSLSSHISVMNCLLVLPFMDVLNVGIFGKNSLQSCLKNLRQGIKIKDFQKYHMCFI